jgi:hypothetical protein
LRRRFLLALGLLALVATLLPLTATTAPKAKKAIAKAVTVQDVGGDYNEGKALPLKRRAQKAPARTSGRQAQASGSGVSAQATSPTPGTVQSWVALDDYAGVAYLKEFTLRGVGENVEVWVASEDDVETDPSLPTADDTNFPEGDCRNGVRTQITDAQVEYFIGEFDNNIYPIESEVFSVPPARDGTGEGLFGPELTRQGDGDNIVVLVDNVRDDNFYDEDNSQNLSYIAGFFWSFINEIHDRNVMTIDAFDWIHRTGAKPPHEPTSNLCTSAPARPFLYEGTFAHEYQHLLEYYEDVDETNWINEGLSDWAQTLTGYVDPATPITEIGYDSHIQCMLGWLGVATDANPLPREGGPENSLTLWGDQDADHESEILCDYGAAYSLMELLHGRYGTDFMTFLHRDDANGLESLDRALREFGARTTARQVLHDWAAALAVDGVANGGRYAIPTMDAVINWDTPETYDTPGAPPNGSDYVRLRDASGRYLSARQLRSLSFDGASALPSRPVEWTVDSAPPGRGTNSALYSGSGDGFDRSIVRRVTVPAGTGATLVFDTLWNTEDQWDYAFVQVSTDGGETYESVSCPGMNSDADPGAIPTVHENLPGYSGSSGGWVTERCSLAAYAGQNVLLAFRYVTDSFATEPGWWIDNVRVGGALVSDGSSLAGWQTMTQVNPVDVEGFTVQLVSYEQARERFVRVTQLHLDGDFDATATTRGRQNLRSLVHPNADVVAAIVMYDEPTELISQYAPYTLTVNGVKQPGGT